MRRARSMRFAAVAVMVAGAVSGAAIGCGPSGGDPPAATVAAPPVVLALTSAAASKAALAIPRDAGEVQLRLVGDIGEVDHLTAELAPAVAPDDARRWRVDPADTASDAATGMVTVPAYALTPGDYVLTLWEGDARVVGRYRFAVLPP